MHAHAVITSALPPKLRWKGRNAENVIFVLNCSLYVQSAFLFLFVLKYFVFIFVTLL